MKRATCSALLALTFLPACVTGVSTTVDTSRTDAGSATKGTDAALGDIFFDGSDAGFGAAATTLANLSSSPLQLIPAFSPSIHDYYVRCAAGHNVLTFTMTPENGTAAFLQPAGPTSSETQVAAIDVLEGAAVVVGGSLGSTDTQYWVRCLAHNFPTLAPGPHPSAGTPFPGYYLLGDTSKAAGEGSYAMVLDANGVPLWYSSTITGREPVDVESLSPNTVSYVAFLDNTFAKVSGKYEIHGLTAATVSYLEPYQEELDLHELQLLPNGDYLMISDPIVAGVDLTGLGSFGNNEYVIGCDVQEVHPTGALVWKWSAMDHFDPVADSTWPQTTTVSGKTIVDPFHCNAIDVSPDGDLLISARHMDSVFLVSRATGAVIWKMGGATASKDNATYLKVMGDPMTSFYRQHDARLLPNGQVSMFDDETSMPGPARAVVYSYDVSAGTASFVWQYQGLVSSAAMGSFRVLPDDSRIIGWGQGGTPGLAFTEVDANGNDLFDFNYSDGDQSYRALKVPLTQLDISVLRNGQYSPAPPTLITVAFADAGASASVDASTVEASVPSGDAGVGCYTLSVVDATEQCSYSATPGCSADAGDAGAAAGSCPSTGLYGCCVELVIVDGGTSASSATCYYSSAAGQLAASQCSFQAYEGEPSTWQTTSP